jgi:hypothetical protein
MESINRDRRATRDNDDDDDGETASSLLDSHIYLMDLTFARGSNLRFLWFPAFSLFLPRDIA